MGSGNPSYWAISIFSIILIFVVLIVNIKSSEKSDRKTLYICTCVGAIVLNIASLFWQLMDAGLIPTVRLIKQLVIATYYSAGLVVSYFWFFTSETYQSSKIAKDRGVRIALFIPVAVLVVISFLSIKTGWFFTVDENGFYERGEFRWIQFAVCCLLIMVTSLKCLIKIFTTKDQDDKLALFVIASFSGYFIFFEYLQNLFWDIPFNDIGVAMGLLQAYFFVQSFQKEQFENSKKIISLAKLFDLSYFIDTNSGKGQLISCSTAEFDSMKILLKDYNNGLRLYVDNYIAEEDRNDIYKMLSCAYMSDRLTEENPTYNYVYKQHNPDGEIIWKKAILILTDTTKRGNKKVLVAVSNITDDVKENARQRQLIQNALDQASEASKSKTRFLSSISHDFKTPLNSIKSFADLSIKKIDDKDKAIEYINNIKTSSNHLFDLVNQILDISRFEEGKLKLSDEVNSLADTLYNIKTIFTPLVDEKNIKFNIITEGIDIDRMYFDKLRLHQLLFNLLTNAIKYTPHNGQIDLIVRLKESANPNFTDCTFIIRDNGIGMDQDFLKHIFQPFERSNATANIQGTGLGLSICKAIVDLQGGTIDVKSKLGEGSEFTVNCLFRNFVVDLENSDVLKGKRVIVVDGNPVALQQLEQYLKELGALTATATTLEECLNFVNDEMVKPFDVYLIPYTTQQSQLHTFIKKLKAIIPDTTKIILTSFSKIVDFKEISSWGIFSYLILPCTKQDILFAYDNNSVFAKPKIKKGPQLEDKRILIVDDNKLNREIAKELVLDLGCIVEEAENGLEAYELVEKNPADYYSLILMDVQMPVLNGYAATKKIRNMDDPVKSLIPIVAMTANAFEEDKSEAFMNGMNAHLGKPLDFEKVKQCILTIIK